MMRFIFEVVILAVLYAVFIERYFSGWRRIIILALAFFLAEVLSRQIIRT